MNILIVHYSMYTGVYKRKTVQEHLYSFRKYTNGKCFYLNAFLGIPTFIKDINFDLIIYHYTFMSLKWGFEDKLLNGYPVLKHLKGKKVAIPQDEYANTDVVNKFFYQYGVETVFTLYHRPEDWQKAYNPSVSGVKKFYTVLAGYVDEKVVKSYQNLTKHEKRTIDIGYRATKNPYWLGFFSLRKWKVTNVFKQNAPSDLILDISNDQKDIFLGNAWHNFLATCRVVIGTEGGASLLDEDGSVRKRVDEYVNLNPSASFEEVEEACFKNKDKAIEYYTITPRCFDAATTKTCQVLVEGYYSGIMEADKHYIPLKADYSNLSDVLNKVKNIDYCEMVAERAYQDIVLSNKYTYRSFVNYVLACSGVKKMNNNLQKTDIFRLRLLELLDNIVAYIFPILIKIPAPIKRLVKKHR